MLLGKDCNWFQGLQAAALLYLTFKVVFLWLLPAVKRLSTPSLDLRKFQGKWALVTGSTDGIGKAYAFALAEKGLNVVLVSRTMSKLDAVAKELRDQHKVEVRVVSVDFIHDDPVSYRLKIAAEIEGLEVCMLVNNVGMSYAMPARFLEIEGGTEEACRNLVKCNVDSVNVMTALILPQMVERRQGVIINVSSLSGATSMPLYSVYSASKAYVDIFSRGLAAEYAPMGVTVQSVLPGYVVSNMSKIRKSTLMAPYPAQFVKSALARLGVESRTTGYWSHDIMLSFMSEWLPEWLANMLSIKQLLQIRKRALKKQEKLQKSE